MVDVVARVLSLTSLRFVVAKGGITSHDVATRGLGIGRAVVSGPMLPGLVSLWQPVDGPAVCIPDVVFPGDVGDADSLAVVVERLARAAVNPRWEPRPLPVPGAARAHRAGQGRLPGPALWSPTVPGERRATALLVESSSTRSRRGLALPAVRRWG